MNIIFKDGPLAKIKLSKFPGKPKKVVVGAIKKDIQYCINYDSYDDHMKAAFKDRPKVTSYIYKASKADPAVFIFVE